MKALAASLALFGLAFACRAQPFDPSLYPNASTGPTFDDKWTLRTPTELCAAARQAVGAPSALCRVERVRTSLPSEEQIPFLSERLVGKSVATVTVSDVVFDLGGEPPARTKPLTLDVRLLPETGEIISITSRWTAPASVWAPVTASVAEKQLIDGGERWHGFLAHPRMSLADVMKSIQASFGGATDAKEIRANVVLWTFGEGKEPQGAWSVEFRGLTVPTDPKGDGTTAAERPDMNVNYFNHLRHIVLDASGRWVTASNTPQADPPKNPPPAGTPAPAAPPGPKAPGTPNGTTDTTNNRSAHIATAEQAEHAAQQLLGGRAGGGLSAERITALDETWVFRACVSEETPAWRVLVRSVMFDVTPSNCGWPGAPACSARPLDITIVLRVSDGALIGARSPWPRESADNFDVLHRTGEQYKEAVSQDGVEWLSPIRPTHTLEEALRQTNFCWGAEQIVVHACRVRDVPRVNDRASLTNNWSIELRSHNVPGRLGGHASVRGVPPGTTPPPETAESRRSAKINMIRYTVSDSQLAWTLAVSTPWPLVVEAAPPPSNIPVPSPESAPSTPPK